MKRRVALLAVLWMIAIPVFSESSVQMGVSFADAFTAFAPLGLLHRSYSDYLFQGTPVAIPNGAALACEATALKLGELHLNLLTQTSSSISLTMPIIASLRGVLAGFCSEWNLTLERWARAEPLDKELLAQASDDGLFAEIKALQDRMQGLLDAFLDGIEEDQALWAFGVAFAMQSMLAQDGIPQIDASIHDILYGASEATEPPTFVPPELADLLIGLAALGGRTLDDDESARAAELARAILDSLLSLPEMGGGKAGC